MKKVLFFRNFDAPSGGHWKLRDYFDHVRATEGFEAKIVMALESRWDETNPWWDVPELVLSNEEGRKYEPDVLFLEGMDWEFLTPHDRDHSGVPVINLIQGLRHADAANPRYAFLSHPATRICVSPEVRAALEVTGRVNGALVTNTNGIDLASLPVGKPVGERSWDLAVVGAKHPGRAQAIGRKLEGLARKSLWRAAEFPGLRVKVLDEMVAREEFLEVLADGRAALFMPLEQEGFYLPALEGMALGTLVICPDVVGNRSFCLDGENCLRPRFSDGELFEACRAALRLSASERERMVARGKETAEKRTLEKERTGFQEVLRRVAA